MLEGLPSSGNQLLRGFATFRKQSLSLAVTLMVDAISVQVEGCGRDLAEEKVRPPTPDVSQPSAFLLCCQVRGSADCSEPSMTLLCQQLGHETALAGGA